MNKKIQNVVDKLKKIKISRGDVHGYFEKMQGNGKTLWLTVIAAFFVMVFVCAAVFFLNVKGPEQVMVPQVCGKKLSNAIIEMGEKELYPTLSVRDVTDQKLDGVILEQNPEQGAIVRGYSRVSLVVGRIAGPDQVADYVGNDVDSVRNKLYADFAKFAVPPVTIAEPEYKTSDKPFGTILEQNPKPGTLISESVELNFIVSKGPEGDSVHPVNLTGKSIDYILNAMEKCLVIYDFNCHIAKGNEKAGTVVEQQKFDDWFVPAYTRVRADIALPDPSAKKSKDDETANLCYGVFEIKLPRYPRPMPMELEADSEGSKTVIARFSHRGARVTVPYSVTKNTTLTLYVAGKPVHSESIN